MARILILISLVTFALCMQTAWALDQNTEDELFSQLTAQGFHKLACELYTAEGATQEDFSEASALLSGTLTLDPRAEYAYLDLLRLLPLMNGNHQQEVLWALQKYIDERSDLEVVNGVVRYLLASQDSRESREQVLQRLLSYANETNLVLKSELATQLGLLASEKADDETAMSYFIHAYNSNEYNRLAFSQLRELKRKAGDPLPPVLTAKSLRMAIDADPMNIDAVVAFARFCEQLGLYDMAAESYQYSADLLDYLYPGRPLPAVIYLQWAMSNYNTRRGLIKCLEVAEEVRSKGTFDLVLEGIAAKASEKVEQSRDSIAISNAGQRAEELFESGAAEGKVTAEQISWFYSFIVPQNDKALAWANSAYSQDFESESTKAIMAYALVMNDQKDLARELVADIRNTNQIAALTLAAILLKEDNKSGAIVILKNAIKMDAGSIVAEKAKELLAANGSDYIPVVSPEIISQALRGEFGARVVPKFAPINKIISAKLSLAGSDFSYGGDFEASVIINNESKGPMLISDYSMFKGNIRVDAEVTGDVSASIPKLVVRRIQLSEPIRAGHFAAISVDLTTGPLRKILVTYPQASVQVKFTVYLDPFVDANGTIRSSMPFFEPVKAVAKRRGDILNQRNLIQRLNALSTGKEGQKARVASFFTGLLMEQYALDESGPLYRQMSVERAIIKDAIRRSVQDDNWKIKTHIMTEMTMLPVPLEYDLTKVVTENLTDEYWPVRIMALYLLDKSHGPSVKVVLDRTAKYDKHWLVRNMAVSLGGDVPKEETEIEPENPENNALQDSLF